jgi:hypothetical protein
VPEFPEFALPLDFGVRLRDVLHLYFHHSHDDPEVPFEHLEECQRALPHAIYGLKLTAPSGYVDRCGVIGASQLKPIR